MKTLMSWKKRKHLNVNYANAAGVASATATTATLASSQENIKTCNYKPFLIWMLN